MKHTDFLVGWDSDFFEFNVAQINREILPREELAAILTGLKKENYRLVYIFVSKRITYFFQHVDMKYIHEKIRYEKNSSTVPY
ncbi:MAG: hypothetical protein QTN59_05520 [Candidatus Electrothrix communis]|nr:MAG: hypothetical protein QTN59_05520 [Candidatus Electrothrix communis]